MAIVKVGAETGILNLNGFKPVQLPTSLKFWVKQDIGNIHVMSLSSCEFREKRCSGSDTDNET